MKHIAYGLMLLVSTLFFVVPVLMEWGVVSDGYLQGFLFLELGLVVHAIAFLAFSEKAI